MEILIKNVAINKNNVKLPYLDRISQRCKNLYNPWLIQIVRKIQTKLTHFSYGIRVGT